MKVRFLVEIQGAKDWKKWPKVGEVADLAEQEAADLIRIGLAEIAERAQTANPELDETPAETDETPAEE